MTEDQLWHARPPLFLRGCEARSNIIQRISRGALAFFLLPLSWPDAWPAAIFVQEVEEYYDRAGNRLLIDPVSVSEMLLRVAFLRNSSISAAWPLSDDQSSVTKKAEPQACRRS